MIKITSALLTILALFTLSIYANDFPEGFNDIEGKPKITISHNQSGWPIYEVESGKFHLYRFSIKPGSPITTYLLKEKLKTEMTDGIEGTRSKIVLELWELGPNKIENKIWRVTQEADALQFSSDEELVLIKYGCCDSPNKYNFYNFKTGTLLQTKEGWKISDVK